MKKFYLPLLFLFTTSLIFPMQTTAEGYLAWKEMKRISTTKPIHQFVYSTDGTRMAIVEKGSNTISIVDTKTHEIMHSLESESSEILSLAFNPEDTTLAAGTADATIEVWNISGNAQKLHTVKGHSGRVTALAFRHDGATLASGSEDATIKLWDTQTNSLLTTLKAHSTPVESLAFQHNQKKQQMVFASASKDATINWMLFDGFQHDEDMIIPSRSITKAQTLASQLVFNTRNTLVFSKDDNTINFQGDRFYPSGPVVYKGHDAPITSLDAQIMGFAFHQYASGSLDKTARVWHATSQSVSNIFHHTSPVSCVKFGKSGKELAVGHDNQITIWKNPYNY